MFTIYCIVCNILAAKAEFNGMKWHVKFFIFTSSDYKNEHKKNVEYISNFLALFKALKC